MAQRWNEVGENMFFEPDPRSISVLNNQTMVFVPTVYSAIERKREVTIIWLKWLSHSNRIIWSGATRLESKLLESAYVHL